MIAVKTKMRKIPEACVRCSYYMRGNDTYYDAPACGAVGGYSGCGKAIGGAAKPTNERAKWCPLVEV